MRFSTIAPPPLCTSLLIHNNILEADQTLSRPASDKHGYSICDLTPLDKFCRSRQESQEQTGDPEADPNLTGGTVSHLSWEHLGISEKEAEKPFWGEVHLDSHAEPAAATTRHRWREHFHAMLCPPMSLWGQLSLLYQQTASRHRMCRVNTYLLYFYFILLFILLELHFKPFLLFRQW